MPPWGPCVPGDGDARLPASRGDTGGRPDRGGRGGAALHTPPPCCGRAPGGDGPRLRIIGVSRPVAHGAIIARLREPPRIHGNGTRRTVPPTRGAVRPCPAAGPPVLPQGWWVQTGLRRQV